MCKLTTIIFYISFLQLEIYRNIKNTYTDKFMQSTHFKSFNYQSLMFRTYFIQSMFFSVL